MSASEFSFRSIRGGELPLSEFRDRAVLVVNTASLCGFTSQYRGLQTLWERYRERGLIVLGVPSNDFGEQEPGTEAEIEAFCHATYAISFPLAAKDRVVGKQAHPFFRWIAEEFGEAAAPRWNFHKYLIAPGGELIGAWPSKVDPLSEEITAPIEAALPHDQEALPGSPERAP
jgi:glutathione peroxidase